MAAPAQADLGPIAEIYSADVKAKFQSAQKLQGIMPEVSNSGAGVRHDWIGTTLEMSEVPTGASEIDTSNVSFSPVVTKPLRFVIKTSIAQSDQSLTNVNLIRAHTQLHGMAAARTVDILKIRAIFENPDIPVGSLTTIPSTIGPNKGLETDKIIAMSTELNNEDVPDEDRIIISNSDQYKTLKKDEKYIRDNYTGRHQLVDGGLKPFEDFGFRKLGKNASNSLPITPNSPNFDSYAVALQFEAMQFIYNVPLYTRIVADNANGNYVIFTELLANAQIIQKAGIVLAALVLDANGDAPVNS